MPLRLIVTVAHHRPPPPLGQPGRAGQAPISGAVNRTEESRVRRYRIKAAVVAAAAALLTASGGSAIAAPTEPDTTVERTAGGVANAGTPVPLPDLGFAHRRSDGGIILFRTPLSELEAGFGGDRSWCARSLRRRAFSSTAPRSWPGLRRLHRRRGRYRRPPPLAPPERRRSEPAVVPGSSNTTPRSLFVLPARTGWAWVNSRPMVGDVTGDGVDDLVVRNVTPVVTGSGCSRATVPRCSPRCS